MPVTKFISGSVSDDMLVEFFEIKLALEENPKDTARIWLNTAGGSCYDGLAAYDLLRPFYDRLTITVVGMCHSAGIGVLLAAKNREATPNSTFLIHDGDSEHKSVSEWEQNGFIRKCYEDIMVDELGISYELARKWHSSETYFDVEKAKKAKLIQKILKVTKGERI